MSVVILYYCSVIYFTTSLHHPSPQLTAPSFTTLHHNSHLFTIIYITLSTSQDTHCKLNMQTHGTDSNSPSVVAPMLKMETEARHESTLPSSAEIDQFQDLDLSTRVSNPLPQSHMHIVYVDATDEPSKHIGYYSVNKKSNTFVDASKVLRTACPDREWKINDFCLLTRSGRHLNPLATWSENRIVAPSQVLVVHKPSVNCPVIPREIEPFLTSMHQPSAVRCYPIFLQPSYHIESLTENQSLKEMTTGAPESGSQWKVAQAAKKFAHYSGPLVTRMPDDELLLKGKVPRDLNPQQLLDWMDRRRAALTRRERRLGEAALQVLLDGSSDLSMFYCFQRGLLVGVGATYDEASKGIQWPFFGIQPSTNICTPCEYIYCAKGGPAQDVVPGGKLLHQAAKVNFMVGDKESEVTIKHLQSFTTDEEGVDDEGIAVIRNSAAQLPSEFSHPLIIDTGATITGAPLTLLKKTDFKRGPHDVSIGGLVGDSKRFPSFVCSVQVHRTIYPETRVVGMPDNCPVVLGRDILQRMNMVWPGLQPCRLDDREEDEKLHIREDIVMGSSIE